MKVTELNKEQMTELKLGYLSELVNEGTFAEVLGVDYDEPTWGDLANVNNLIPDDLIIEHYDGVEFTEDDFFGLLDR